MKQINAYIRRELVNETVEALKRARSPGITVVEVHPVGYGYEPNYFESDYTSVVDSYNHLAVVKLEIICADPDLYRLSEIIIDRSRTGESGDGIIFVSEVLDAMRIRDGVHGESALS